MVVYGRTSIEGFGFFFITLVYDLIYLKLITYFDSLSLWV